MQYLAEDTATVTGYFTLDEGRAIFSLPFTHYLLTLTAEDNGHSTEDSAQVLTVVTENTRYTKATFSTTGLKAGRYSFVIYAQDSASNTDKEDSSVVGIIERGLIQLTNDSTIFTNGELSINRDIEAV